MTVRRKNGEWRDYCAGDSAGKIGGSRIWRSAPDAQKALYSSFSNGLTSAMWVLIPMARASSSMRKC
ncbi:hypothetical protein AB7W72_23030, partial [Providencia rettgeri]